MDYTNKLDIKSDVDSTIGIHGKLKEPPRNPITIPIDDEVILFFKRKAYEERVSYHTLMNRVLRDYIKQHI